MERGSATAPGAGEAGSDERDAFDAALIPGIRDRMAEAYRALRLTEAEQSAAVVDDRGNLRPGLLAARDCPICGADGGGATPFLKARGLDYVSCHECSFTYTRQGPDNGYFSLSSEDDARSAQVMLGLKGNEAYRSLEQRKVAYILGRIARHGGSRGTLLDIGPANGALLSLAQAKGWTAWGLESNPAYVAECRRTGLRVEQGIFPQDLPAEWPRFNAVVMLDVLEHAPAPLDFLGRVRDRLEPGGILAIQVPNLDSLRIRLEGAANNNFILGHWSFFSPETLDGVVARAGFVPVGRETIISELDRIVQHPPALIRRMIADLRGVRIPDGDVIDSALIHKFELGYKVLALFRTA